eukprot:1131292-Pyramimonas_sp.AAC.1
MSREQIALPVARSWGKDGTGQTQVCKLDSVQKKHSTLDEEVSSLGSTIHKQYPNSLNSLAYSLAQVYTNVSSMLGILRNVVQNGKNLPETVPVLVSIPRKMLERTMHDLLSQCDATSGMFVSPQWASKEFTWVQANMQLSALRDNCGWRNANNAWWSVAIVFHLSCKIGEGGVDADTVVKPDIKITQLAVHHSVEPMEMGDVEEFGTDVIAEDWIDIQSYMKVVPQDGADETRMLFGGLQKVASKPEADERAVQQWAQGVEMASSSMKEVGWAPKPSKKSANKKEGADVSRRPLLIAHLQCEDLDARGFHCLA